MAGWWGHDKHSRFNMGPEFHPIPGVEGWQLSNPPILPLAALRASLEIFRDAGMSRLRTKSEQLTAYLESLLAAMCGDTVSILTPSHPAERGCQLSVRVKGGRRAHEALLAKGVMCDWRDPDVIRLAPAPLYNRFVDVYDCVEILRSI